MSNIVSALVQKRKVGSPTRKAILMFMASYASDDGSGVWASKANMARDLEMGKRTVQIGIDDLVEQGLISEVGTRKCAHGFTVEYRLNLGAIRALEQTNPDSRKASAETGAGYAPVQDVHPTGAGDAPHGVQDMHPNHPGTTLEPVCAAIAAEHTHPSFEDFWKVYPRPRNRAATERAFAKAVANGANPDTIVASAKAYADENKGNAPQYITFSENWLKDERWQDHEAETKPVAAADGLAMYYAERISAGKRIYGPPVSVEVRDSLVSVHGLTPEQIDRAQAPR